MLQDTLRLTIMNAPQEEIQATGMKGGRPYNVSVIGQELEGYKVHVTFPIKSPAEDFKKAQLAVQLQALLPIRTLQEEYLGRESPDDEFDRLLAEKVMMNPQVVQMAMQEIMERWYPEMLAKMQAMQNQAAPPTQGPPAEKIPPMPGTPGMPMVSQPGRPPLPQEVGMPPGSPMEAPQEPMQGPPM
jgi:hypothetical protein